MFAVIWPTIPPALPPPVLPLYVMVPELYELEMLPPSNTPTIPPAALLLLPISVTVTLLLLLAAFVIEPLFTQPAIPPTQEYPLAVMARLFTKTLLMLPPDSSVPVMPPTFPSAVLTRLPPLTMTLLMVP